MLSKSKLLSFRQCPRRLWLEVHRKDLQEVSAATKAILAVGNQVGELARRLYDPEENGQLIDAQTEGFNEAFVRSKALLSSNRPVFEAGFCAEGALVLADVMLPVGRGKKKAWRMVEVKSATSVKDYHRDDAAIQAFIVRSAGVPLNAIALAHIDSGWVYPGNGDYRGLLCENDLTEEAFGRAGEVKEWIRGAQAIVRKKTAPKCETGDHCTDPYECGFLNYCASLEPLAQYPVSWLPRIQAKSLKEFVASRRGMDLREVPDDLLNALQQRVKSVTQSELAYFNQEGARRVLSEYKLPAFFMDFETIQFAVPIWKGTRPYQQIPFQFSVHRLGRTGKLDHCSFLDLSGDDPSKKFAEALISACGERGPVFVYNEGFEKSRINELAERFPRLAKPLIAINERLVDLLPVVREHYYHPDQRGSWSIKAVLPTACPDLRYEDLEGVQHGGMAMGAFMEALSPNTTISRKEEIGQQLLAYCALDTYAMVRLWSLFAGFKLEIPNAQKA